MKTKTKEEILERYLSEDTVDFFSAQRMALLTTLPFEMAKPYLHPDYVKGIEENTLPEEEKWVEGYDIKEQILGVIPQLYKACEMADEVHISEGLLFIKSWIWVIDEEFYKEIEPLLDEDLEDFGKSIIDKIAKHYNYKPTIEDVDFEEVPEGGTRDTSIDSDLV